MKSAESKYGKYKSARDVLRRYDMHTMKPYAMATMYFMHDSGVDVGNAIKFNFIGGESNKALSMKTFIIHREKGTFANKANIAIVDGIANKLSGWGAERITW